MIPRVLVWRQCEGQKLKGSVLAEVGTFQQVGSHIAVRNPTQASRRPGSIFTRVAFPSWPERRKSGGASSPAWSDRQTLRKNSQRRKKKCLASHQPGFHVWVVQKWPGIGGLHQVISGSCRLKFRFAVTAVRLRRTQIVCSAAALASSLFIRVDQSRLFTIWVITHHAHLIELRLLYIL